MSLSAVAKALKRLDRYSGIHDRDTIARIIRALPTVPGGDGLISNLSRATSDDVFDDYLAEAWYVAVFLSCGCRVEIYPTGSSGPDLKVQNTDFSMYVEVTRFRPANAGPQDSTSLLHPDELAEYGRPQKDTAKARKKVFDKFDQVAQHSSVVAIWNDDGSMEEVEVLCAVRDLQGNRALPTRLEFVIYGSVWVGERQFHSFQLSEKLSEPAALFANLVCKARLSHSIRQMVAGFA